jgi:hypothetical protein
VAIRTIAEALAVLRAVRRRRSAPIPRGVKDVWGEPDVCSITTLSGDSKPLLITNMQRPCVARSRTEAAALIVRELDLYRGRAPFFIVPCEQAESIRQLYPETG